MPREITPATRKVLSAAGRKGGHTGVKNTIPALHGRLKKLKAEFDAEGNLVDSPATRKAWRLMADDMHLANAQKALAREKARAKPKAGKST